MDQTLRELERKALTDTDAADRLAITRARCGLQQYRQVRSGGNVISDLMGERVWRKLSSAGSTQIQWGYIASVYVPSISASIGGQSAGHVIREGHLRCIVRIDSGGFDDRECCDWNHTSHKDTPADPNKE